MKKYVFAFLFLLIALHVGNEKALAFSKGEHDCSKCHTLTQEQAKDVLKTLVSDVTILEVRKGPIEGVWEVAVETANKKGVVYIDYSKKYIISGSFIVLETKANVTKDRFDELNKVDVSQIPLEDALILGKKDAKYKIIVFDDPD